MISKPMPRTFGFRDLGFRGFGVKGFRDLGFRVGELGFRALVVLGGFRIQDLGVVFWLLGVGASWFGLGIGKVQTYSGTTAYNLGSLHYTGMIWVCIYFHICIYVYTVRIYTYIYTHM